MTPSDALHILDQLISGIHPVTGEILPDNHVCCAPPVLRALHQAIMALKASPHAAVSAPQNPPPDADRPWTKPDDQKLRLLFRHDLPVDAIAQALDRSPQGVMDRLKALRLMPAGSASAQSESGPGNAWTPWFAEDDQQLSDLYEARAPIEEIAAFFKRSEGAIQHRMVHLGLIERAGQYTGGVRPWKQSDTALLIAMHQKQQSVASMAQHFECSEEAIRARLFYLGLSKEAPKVLPSGKNRC